MKKLFIIIPILISLLICALPVSAADVQLTGGTYTNILTLENKDTSTWAIIQDGIGATLGYNASGETFVWGLEAQGLADGDYSLIYYADFEERFNQWGGNNPGAVIATVTSAGGVISDSGEIDLNMDLPCPPDANQYLIDYSDAPDFYANAHGAKIWLVPTAVLTGGAALPITAWSPNNNWLFETDLITYDDTGIESTVVSVSVDVTSINFGILVPGQTGNGGSIKVSNTGTCPINVTASVTGNLFQYILLDSIEVYQYLIGLDVSGYDDVVVTLPVPVSYVPTGAEAGTLTFSATAQ